MTEKKNSTTIDLEFGVDSRYKTKKERGQDSIMLMEARLQRMKEIPKDQILRAKLMQLKLKMEEYLNNPVYDGQMHFAHFLKTYVDTLYSKRVEFASDINETPVFLSKVINGHREPKEEFILKLMIHSEKVFDGFVEFKEHIWYQIYLHEKLCEAMSNRHKWQPLIEKDVKFTTSIFE